jgi:hypothetical protein
VQRIAAASGAKQVADTARNSWRGVDPVHAPWRERGHLADQQGIVRASQNHRVCPRSVIILAVDETRRDLGGDGVVADVLAP